MTILELAYIVRNVYHKKYNKKVNILLPDNNNPQNLKSSQDDKKTIVEALKIKDINNINKNKLISINDSDKLIKFRQFY